MKEQHPPCPEQKTSAAPGAAEPTREPTSAAPAVNQCDGCLRNMPLTGDLHRNADGRAEMVCTADRYAAPAAAGMPQPVAWRVKHKTADGWAYFEQFPDWHAENGYEIESLHTTAASEVAQDAARPTDAERLAWLHSAASNNVDGYEWGIYRVRWEHGRAVEVWQTYSDFSDLDAALRASQQGERK